MLYSRADTLENFGNYTLIKNAGINSILMGIESLDPFDLKKMRKKQVPELSSKAIRSLRDNKIFCDLCFILFNKSATID